jgi:hypothetical protein
MERKRSWVERRFTFGLCRAERCGIKAKIWQNTLKRKVKITREILHTVTPWTIYYGCDVTGWPVMTMVRGHIVMEWPEGEPRARISDGSPGEYQRRKLAR